MGMGRNGKSLMEIPWEWELVTKLGMGMGRNGNRLHGNGREWECKKPFPGISRRHPCLSPLLPPRGRFSRRWVWMLGDYRLLCGPSQLAGQTVDDVLRLWMNWVNSCLSTTVPTTSTTIVNIIMINRTFLGAIQTEYETENLDRLNMLLFCILYNCCLSVLFWLPEQFLIIDIFLLMCTLWMNFVDVVITVMSSDVK